MLNQCNKFEGKLLYYWDKSGKIRFCVHLFKRSTKWSNEYYFHTLLTIDGKLIEVPLKMEEEDARFMII